MAEYKVLQDIEAEDKIIGWMSLRQLFFAFGAGIILFVGFLVTRSVGNLLPMIFFILPAGVLIIFSLPLSKYQPMEIWLGARIRFLISPRRHVWDMSGIVNPITITAPKRQLLRVNNNLTQSEVHSRLSALASTLDTRGWAYKKVTSSSGDYQSANNIEDNIERLVNTGDLPSEVPEFDLRDADDILDSSSNPIAMQLDQMMQASTNQLRTQATTQMYASQQVSMQIPEPMLPRPTITNNIAPATVQFAKPNNMAGQPPTPSGNAPIANQYVIPDNLRTNLAGRNDLNVASIASIAQNHQNRNQVPPHQEMSDNQTISLR